MRFLVLILATSLAFGAEEKPAPIDRQDLINVCVAARHALPMMNAQEMVFVAISIQRLEAIADKLPKVEPPKPPDLKPKE
jgi:hypothetical protein